MTVAITCLVVQIIKYVQRVSKQQSRIVRVPIPDLISKYNANVEGTDRVDI